ncbi:hypothetical protein BV20DRAFT_963986 [Pilatotrama ljubarskyi]|nr:hypothetical protein BV20DRAFT_963986 [Pilatotrama ljubarskyi]
MFDAESDDAEGEADADAEADWAVEGADEPDARAALLPDSGGALDEPDCELEADREEAGPEGADADEEAESEGAGVLEAPTVEVVDTELGGAERMDEGTGRAEVSLGTGEASEPVIESSLQDDRLLVSMLRVRTAYSRESGCMAMRDVR